VAVNVHVIGDGSPLGEAHANVQVGIRASHKIAALQKPDKLTDELRSAPNNVKPTHLCCDIVKQISL
jgi:hypothetical protein